MLGVRCMDLFGRRFSYWQPRRRFRRGVKQSWTIVHVHVRQKYEDKSSHRLSPQPKKRSQNFWPCLEGSSNMCCYKDLRKFWRGCVRLLFISFGRISNLPELLMAPRSCRRWRLSHYYFPMRTELSWICGMKSRVLVYSPHGLRKLDYIQVSLFFHGQLTDAVQTANWICV